MGVAELLTEDLVVLDLQGSTRDEVIEELVDCLDTAGVLRNREDFLQAVLERERQYTTGIGSGVAIPHGKSASVIAPRVAFGRKLTGIDWNSMDGEKVKLVFLIAVPEEQAGTEHLKILQALARKLVDDSFRAQLVNARTREEVISVMQAV